MVTGRRRIDCQGTIYRHLHSKHSSTSQYKHWGRHQRKILRKYISIILFLKITFYSFWRLIKKNVKTFFSFKVFFRKDMFSEYSISFYFRLLEYFIYEKGISAEKIYFWMVENYAKNWFFNDSGRFSSNKNIDSQGSQNHVSDQCFYYQWKSVFDTCCKILLTITNNNITTIMCSGWPNQGSYKICHSILGGGRARKFVTRCRG